jgi:Fe-S oxidoreductase
MLLYRLLNKEIQLNEDIAYVFYNCTNCGRCYIACETKISNPPEWIEETRYMLASRNMITEKVRALRENILRHGNTYGLSGDKLLDKISDMEEIFEGWSDTLYYVGGDIRSRHAEIAEKTIELFRKLSINVKVLRDEPPDGGILYIFGFRNEARKLATRLIEKIKSSGVNRIIVSDPLAYASFKVYYPKMGINLGGLEVVHVLELLSEKPMKFDRLAVKVTYHDPCFLGRRSTGVYEPPRMLLKKIPGLELREAAFNRDNAFCCGGLLQPIDEYWAKKVAEMLAERLGSKDVDLIVTACPRCHDSLRNIGVKTLDIVEILNEQYLPGV